MKKGKKILSILTIVAMVLTMFSNFKVVRAEEVELNFRVDPSNNYVCFDLPDFGMPIVKRVTLRTLDGETMVNRYVGYPGDDYSVIKMLQIGAKRDDLAKGKINADGTGTYQYNIEILEQAKQSNVLKTYEGNYIKYYINSSNKDVVEAVKPIKSLELTVDKPEIGSKNEEVEINLGGWGYTTGSNNPIVKMEPDLHIEINEGLWIKGGSNPQTEGYYDIFEGTFENGKAYYAQVNISSESGYFIDSNVDLKINGQTPELVEVYDNEIINAVVKVYCGEEPPEYTLGDINGDGKINADDAADAIEIFKTNAQTPENIAKGDMDGNGRVTAEDSALIIEYFKTHH